MAAQKALEIIANVWAVEIHQQNKEKLELKLAWDSCFDPKEAGPACEEYREDRQTGRSGGGLLRREKRKRRQERRKKTEERRLAYVKSLHRLQLLRILETTLRRVVGY